MCRFKKACNFTYFSLFFVTMVVFCYEFSRVFIELPCIPGNSFRYFVYVSAPYKIIETIGLGNLVIGLIIEKLDKDELGITYSRIANYCWHNYEIILLCNLITVILGIWFGESCKFLGTIISLIVILIGLVPMFSILRCLIFNEKYRRACALKIITREDNVVLKLSEYMSADDTSLSVTSTIFNELINCENVYEMSESWQYILNPINESAKEIHTSNILKYIKNKHNSIPMDDGVRLCNAYFLYKYKSNNLFLSSSTYENEKLFKKLYNNVLKLRQVFPNAWFVNYLSIIYNVFAWSSFYAGYINYNTDYVLKEFEDRIEYVAYVEDLSCLIKSFISSADRVTVEDIKLIFEKIDCMK